MNKPKFNARKTVKFVASAVATAGTSIVVKQVIKNNVTPENTYTKIGVVVGAYVISSMISAQASKHAEQQVDSAFDYVAKTKAEITENIITTEV